MLCAWELMSKNRRLPTQARSYRSHPTSRQGYETFRRSLGIFRPASSYALYYTFEVLNGSTSD